MLNKLSRKDIELLNILAQTPEGKSALDEYIKQHEKAVKAYKIYRESVVAEVEVDKVVETKRKFKVGDKVRVTSIASDVDTATWWSVGDIAEVTAYKNDSPEEWLFNSKRPVIVTGEYSRCAYFAESALELVEEKSQNELRAEIIQRAKDVLNAWKWENNSGHDGYRNLKLPTPYHNCVMVVEFVVNVEKRTVVASLRGYESFTVATKGVAKCNPDDVFNEHIGKAIALGRALGKDVSEFENAPQPTEPVIGHKLSDVYCDDIDEITAIKRDCMFINNTGGYWGKDTLDSGITKIIDDTDAQYGGIEQWVKL